MLVNLSQPPLSASFMLQLDTHLWLLFWSFCKHFYPKYLKNIYFSRYLKLKCITAYWRMVQIRRNKHSISSTQLVPHLHILPSTVPHRLYKYIRPDNLSGCLRLTAQKAYQPERMSRCKVFKPAKMSRLTKEAFCAVSLRQPESPA